MVWSACGNLDACRAGPASFAKKRLALMQRHMKRDSMADGIRAMGTRAFWQARGQLGWEGRGVAISGGWARERGIGRNNLWALLSLCKAASLAGACLRVLPFFRCMVKRLIASQGRPWVAHIACLPGPLLEANPSAERPTEGPSMANRSIHGKRLCFLGL